jgi:hypothetical protein
MSGCLVAASDNFLGESWMAFGGLADHVGGHFNAVAVPQVEQAGDALPVAVGEPCVGGSVRRDVVGKVNFGERAVGAFRGLSSRFKHH